MTKRDIKTIVRQVQKGLDYETALRSLIQLSEPCLTSKQVTNIVRSIQLFKENLDANKSA